MAQHKNKPNALESAKKAIAGAQKTGTGVPPTPQQAAQFSQQPGAMQEYQSSQPGIFGQPAINGQQLLDRAVPAATKAAVQGGLAPVPHHIAQQLAQAVSGLHPIALGTLIYHALQQHGVSLNGGAVNPQDNGGQPGFSAGLNTPGGGAGYLQTPNQATLGGNVQLGGGNYAGGAIGVKQGQPTGQFNINGQTRGSFGPQGY